MTQELKDSLRNAGKFVTEKEKELKEDMEDAREDRMKQEQKNLKKSNPPKTEAQATKPASVPEVKKK